MIQLCVDISVNILFIEFMYKGKSLNDFTNLFSPNDNF